MPASKRSRITLNRVSDNAIKIQWQFPLATKTTRDLFAGCQVGTTLTIGSVELLEDSSPAFIPAKTEAARVSLRHPEVQRRVCQVVATVAEEIAVGPR